MDCAGLALRQQEAHVLVPVRAQPRARRNGILGLHDGALRIATTQPADAGRANEAIRRILADALDRPLGDVTLVSGGASRRKAFRVDRCTPAQVEARLKEYC